jgi:hypothetical protein
MSLVSLSSLAVARDLTPGGQPLSAVSKGIPAAGPTIGPTPANASTPPIGSIAGFAQLLTAQIPSEALIAYTTLLALFYTLGKPYNTGRWVLYGLSVFACGATLLAAYFAKRNYTLQVPAGAPLQAPADQGSSGVLGSLRRLHLPYLPTFAAMLSMAVYGLTVPGSPLQFAVSGAAFSVLSGSLSVGGALVMSMIAPFLGKGNDAVPATSQKVGVS